MNTQFERIGGQLVLRPEEIPADQAYVDGADVWIFERPRSVSLTVKTNLMVDLGDEETFKQAAEVLADKVRAKVFDAVMNAVRREGVE